MNRAITRAPYNIKVSVI